MAERNGNNGSSFGIVARKSLFCLFIVATTLFIFSWFSVLRSAARPRFTDRASLPSPKLPNSKETRSSSSAILNYEEEREQEREGVEEREEVNKESPNRNINNNNNNNKPFLKVFMYDLSPEFHFGLLGWDPRGGGGGGGDRVWPDLRAGVPAYPGGLNLQHSIEYWLTLDILASELPGRGPRSVERVGNASEADVVFVPFFSSLSYNRLSKKGGLPGAGRSGDEALQEKVVRFVTSREEWRSSGGRDHLIVAHHPNSMTYARTKLWPATFILADFGRYPPTIANVDKDVVAPYKHLVASLENDSSSFDSRPTLLYFQGAIYRKDGGYIRQELFYLLKDEKDVHFAFGSVQKDGIGKATRGMQSSKFCLNIAGDTPSSNRLFDAIASHCVPVIVSDDIELPYEDVLDYSEFCVFVRSRDAIKEKHLVTLVRGIGKAEWTRMWERLKEVESLFEFRYPSREGDAVQMIWRAVARRVPAVRMRVNKSRRFSRHSVRSGGGVSSVPSSPRNFW